VDARTLIVSTIVGIAASATTAYITTWLKMREEREKRDRDITLKASRLKHSGLIPRAEMGGRRWLFSSGGSFSVNQMRTVCESDGKSNKETVVWTGEWNTEPAGSDLAHPDKELELLTLDPS
jgi:exonuclease III